MKSNNNIHNLIFVPLVMLQLSLSATIHADDLKPAPENEAPSSAMTISVHGKCDYSEDGVTFIKLEKGQSVEQGAIIYTGDDARADLFFRRTGTTVRLQPGTGMRIEKMTASAKDGLPIELTLLDLRTGRIFIVVRSKVAGSTLEIRNAAGRAIVEGSGIGRYIITADGTHVTAKGSVIPCKVIGEDGITIVAAGQQFAKKDGKTLPVNSNLWVKELIEIDELQAIMETTAVVAPSPKP